MAVLKLLRFSGSKLPPVVFDSTATGRLRGPHLLHTFFHADNLDRIGTAANAGCIDQSKQYALDIDDLFHRVSRCAGDLTDDGAILIEQRVQ